MTWSYDLVAGSAYFHGTCIGSRSAFRTAPRSLDRMLIAQDRIEHLPIVTSDPKFKNSRELAFKFFSFALFIKFLCKESCPEGVVSAVR